MGSIIDIKKGINSSREHRDAGFAVMSDNPIEEIGSLYDELIQAPAWKKPSIRRKIEDLKGKASIQAYLEVAKNGTIDVDLLIAALKRP